MRATGLARVFSSLVCFFVFMCVYLARTAACQDIIPPRGSAPGVLPSEIRGTVTINGLEPDPARIRVRAVPLGVRTSDGRRYTPDPRATTKMAAFTSTDDPHTITFSIKGLMPGVLYQIGVSLPPSPIVPEAGGTPGFGKVFWRGPMDGLAVSGGPAVALEGFAARTEVEVLQPATGEWVGADTLQFDDPAAAKRTFRWRTSIPNVTGAELQISTTPFPTKGNFGTCDEPETGIVARQSLTVTGNPADNQRIASIDFGPILGIRTSDVIGPSSAGTADTRGTQPITDHARRLLMMGAPVYVRVIPKTTDGPACATKQDGVAGWAMLGKGSESFNLPSAGESPKIVPWDGHTYTPPYLGEPQGHPTYGELGYKVIKDHKLPIFTNGKNGWQCDTCADDPLGYILIMSNPPIASPGSTLTKGKWFFFLPNITSGDDGNWFSAFTGLAKAFGGLATATLNFAGSVVDYFHNLTSQIENKLAETVVDLASWVPGVGPLCNAVGSTHLTTCEGVVKAGLEYGMTSMGMPPSIPSWDELQKEGADYLAAMVASEIGIPEEYAKDITKDIVEQNAQVIVQNTMARISDSRGGDDPKYDWVISYLGFEPAVWKISVYQPGSGDLPDNLFLRVPETTLYLGANVRVPSKFPAANNYALKIPVVLQPNTAGILAPDCRFNIFSIDQSHPYGTCQPDLFQNKPTCWTQTFKWNQNETGGGHWEYVQVDCSVGDWPNWLGVYYRDAWIAQKYSPAACTTLGASSFTDSFGLWLPFTPPFKAIALLPPHVGAEWDGELHFGCN